MESNIFARSVWRTGGGENVVMEETMRTETDEIRDNLKYLTLLSRDYPSQAAAASEIISTQALLKLPKGTEHFMSDLHGENEAFCAYSEFRFRCHSRKSGSGAGRYRAKAYPRRAGNADLLPQRKSCPSSRHAVPARKR